MSSEKESIPRERLLSLDVLRGLAVILMVEQHLGVWLYSLRDPGAITRGFFLLNALGGLAAPLFVLLAGAGVALGNLRASVLRKRGATLLLLGFALNVAVPSWFSPESFYILHLLGVWLILVPFFRELDDRNLLVLGGVVLVTSVLGQSFLETPLRLDNERLRDGSLSGGALRLAFFEGQFPIFPWLSLGLCGLWSGRRLRAGRLRDLLGFALGLGAVALVCQIPRAVLGLPAVRELPLRALVRVSFYPATTTFILTMAALGTFLLYLSALAESRGRLRAVKGLRYLGQTSLSLLVFHIVIFRELFSRMGLWRVFDATETLSAMASLLLLWGVMSEYWVRAHYAFGLEWLLRKVSGRQQQQPEEG